MAIAVTRMRLRADESLGEEVRHVAATLYSRRQEEGCATGFNVARCRLLDRRVRIEVASSLRIHLIASSVLNIHRQRSADGINVASKPSPTGVNCKKTTTLGDRIAENTYFSILCKNIGFFR